MRVVFICCICVLAGCASIPPISRQTTSSAALDAPYPSLEPLSPLLARAEAGSTVAAQTEALEARVAALKARAAALKGRSVFDGATRLRLLQAGQRNAARSNP